MKKIVKRCLICVILIGIFAGVFCFSFVGVKYVQYQQVPLQMESLTSSALSIDVFDDKNRRLKDENQFNGDYVKLSELPAHTKEAFISIEDKDFYKHNGTNKKRIVKAMLNNIKSGSLKEGASTISQQLIKNTHLSNEKTMERKLRELALTKKLEKNFEKDEILEFYLNAIYFGNNCYGIENASKYYFNKPAKDLSLSESCALAGMIKSPTHYSPIHKMENCIVRRNVVLSQMQKDGKITASERLQAEGEKLQLNIRANRQNKLNSYSQASIDEASRLLKLPAKSLAIGGYQIHTYFDEQKQEKLMDSLTSACPDDCSACGIVINNASHGVEAYYGTSHFKLMDTKRQPASCLKPILVYAPALNEDVVMKDTQILDEKINIGGFEPTNVNKKFAGYISVCDAVKNSVNIPAIKVLSYIGIDTGKEYAEKLGVNFDQADDSYALALGGMTYGVNLQTLATAYTTFANAGNFCPSTFVKYITDKDNKLVYVHKPQTRMVFREDTAAIMTDILQETAKSGTARKLSGITNTQIASKTGTVGKKNASGNTDAYNISFTPEETIGVWMGNLDNKPQKIAGGNQPTQVVLSYVGSQYYSNREFSRPSSVTEVEIDSLEKEENHRLVLANPYAPARYKEKVLVSRFNMPSEISTNFVDPPKIDAQAQVEKNQIVLTIKAQKMVDYEVLKNNIPYQKITDKQGQIVLRLPFNEKEAKVVVNANYQNTHENQNSKTFTLSKPQQTQPHQEWYI